MVKSLSVDKPNQLRLLRSEQEKSKYKRNKAREKKKQEIIERLNLTNDGLGPLNSEIDDRVEEWIDEDFEQMDIDLDDEEQFRNDLSGDFNIPITKTGSRWYSHHKPLGRFIKSIRENNNEHSRTTILIIRGGDESIYRLGIPKGEETSVLSTAISKGYILTEVKVKRVDT
jgi:hypothetical protein